MTTPAEVRQSNILEILGNEPLTCEELANKMGMNYHTIYKDLRALQENGLVHYTGQVRGKSFVWAAGATSGIPQFYDPAGNRHIKVNDIVAAYSINREAASIKAARAFFETLEQLLTIANELAVGDSDVSQKDLQKIRHTTIVNKSFVKNLNGYYEQLLANPSFWEVEKLAAVGLQLKNSAVAE